MPKDRKTPSSQRQKGPEPKKPAEPQETSEELKEATSVKCVESMAEELLSLKASLSEERSKAEDYLNRLKYLQADFENYRKRVQRDILDVAQLSKEKLILNLLSILDELELAVQAGEKTQNKEALMDGVKVTLKKFYDLLRDEGVAVIEADGKPFDPRLHEAVSTIEREDLEAPSVVDEVRKGFTMSGKVIRPSKVTVATSASRVEVGEEKMAPLTVAEKAGTLAAEEKHRPPATKKVKEDE